MKIDLKKEYKDLYSATKTPKLVDVPEQKIIYIDGKGDPNTATSFTEAMETLFPMAFTIKFLSKNELKQDYVVMPSEALWWAEDMDDFILAKKDNWLWRSFIVQPDCITRDLFDLAKETVKKKKNPPALDKLRFESLSEGHSAQIMHIGPYSEEAPTIEKLHTFIQDQGFTFDGLVQKHHEIYLSDMRRVAPEKLKTIIRQPVG